MLLAPMALLVLCDFAALPLTRPLRAVGTSSREICTSQRCVPTVDRVGTRDTCTQSASGESTGERMTGERPPRERDRHRLQDRRIALTELAREPIMSAHVLIRGGPCVFTVH